MSVTEIGALIVALRSESAQFRAEMEGARKTLKGAGDQASVSSRQIAKLAADGFGAVLPISFQAENAIERFIEKALKAQGALALLGKATLLLGAGLAAFKLGSVLGEILALGSSVEAYEKKVKDAVEEQKKFVTELGRIRSSTISLQRELATLTGDTDAVIELARALRDAEIISRTALGPARDRQLGLSAKIETEQLKKALIDRRAARDADDQKLLDQILKERDAQAKAWQDETRVLLDQLKARTAARAAFEAQFGQGGLGGTSAVGGLAAARTLRAQIEKEARDLAFAEREGLITPRDASGERENIRQRALQQAEALRVEFQGFPVVLEAIGRAVDSVDFGNFGREMQDAAQFIRENVASLGELQGGLGRVAAALAAVPPHVDPAIEAVRQLSAEYLGLSSSIYAAVNAQLAFNAVTAQ